LRVDTAATSVELKAWGTSVVRIFPSPARWKAVSNAGRSSTLRAASQGLTLVHFSAQRKSHSVGRVGWCWVGFQRRNGADNTGQVELKNGIV